MSTVDDYVRSGDPENPEQHSSGGTGVTEDSMMPAGLQPSAVNALQRQVYTLHQENQHLRELAVRGVEDKASSSQAAPMQLHAKTVLVFSEVAPRKLWFHKAKDTFFILFCY